MVVKMCMNQHDYHIPCGQNIVRVRQKRAAESGPKLGGIQWGVTAQSTSASKRPSWQIHMSLRRRHCAHLRNLLSQRAKAVARLQSAPRANSRLRLPAHCSCLAAGNWRPQGPVGKHVGLGRLHALCSRW